MVSDQQGAFATERLAAARRTRWGAVDQALSSLTNFALGVLIARQVSTTQLGAFALAYAGYVFAVGLARGGILSPLLVRFSDAPPAAQREATKCATGMSVVAGFGAALVSFAVAVAVGGSSAATLAVLGLCLPGLLLQDAWRFVFFTRGRPALAAANDTCWAVTQLLFVSAVFIMSSPSTATLVAAWGAAGTVAAIIGIAQARVFPRVSRTGVWIKSQRDLGWRFAAEFVATGASPQVVVLLLGAIAGLAAVGAFRGAQILMSPTNLVFAGAPLIAIPEGARLLSRSRRRLRAYVRGVSGVVTLLTAGWCVAVLLIPTSAGHALLGLTWEPGRALLPALIVLNLAGAAITGAVVGLRVTGAARTSIRVRAVQSALMLMLGGIGAVAAGAEGAAWGMAIAASFCVVLWWRSFRA